uniref:Secreted protein n=1 Tax=Heterorhabditis bacteriophora TaxID=37862 RepID=A0A1I7WDW1_HETBA
MVSSLECLVDRKYQFLHFFFNSSACTTFEGSYRLPDMWSLVILCSVVVASVLSLPTSTQIVFLISPEFALRNYFKLMNKTNDLYRHTIANCNDPQIMRAFLSVGSSSSKGTTSRLSSRWPMDRRRNPMRLSVPCREALIASYPFFFFV